VPSKGCSTRSAHFRALARACVCVIIYFLPCKKKKKPKEKTNDIRKPQGKGNEILSKRRKKIPPKLQSEPAVGQLNSTAHRCSRENTHSPFN